MIRLRLDLAYDGTAFAGWARQPGQRTVEETVAAGLATVLRLPELPVLTVAGRTDAGVHASGQVAHVDLDATDPAEVDPARVVRGLAGVLASDVVVRAVAVAPTGFDARFSALARRYRYRVTDTAPDPLRRHDTVAWPRPLDVEAMAAAATGLLGEHDFAAYCRARAGATTVRTLRRLEVARRVDDPAMVEVYAEADAFCHQQVRSMVGALLAVGDGRRPAYWPGQVLRAGVRDGTVTVAPAHGLTLVAVDYPPDEELANRALEARRRRISR